MIFYFSATGNSKYVADRVAAVTGELCISIAECIKAQRFTFSPDKEEPIGILSPVYCWGLPSIMNEFLESGSPISPHISGSPPPMAPPADRQAISPLSICAQKD